MIFDKPIKKDMFSKFNKTYNHIPTIGLYFYCNKVIYI